MNRHAELITARIVLRKEAADLVALRTRTPEQEARMLEVHTQLRPINEEIEQIELRNAGGVPFGTYARTNDREATYSKRKNEREKVSFFTDLYAMNTGRASGAIAERLQAHEKETIGTISERAATSGSFGGLVAPQYLVDLAAPIARAGRPAADVVRHLTLPEQGTSIIVPKQTAPTSVAVQATQNTSVSSSDAGVTDLVIPVATIAGQTDVSRQSIERGAQIDELLFSDLVGAYNVNLDAQVLAGTGSNGQMMGILNTAGVIQMPAFAAAVTPGTFWSKFAGAIVQVQTNRFLAPTGVIVHPRRWAWLTSLLDSNNRPLVVPNTNGPQNAQGHYTEPIDTPSAAPAGWFQGVPIYTDSNMPTAVGSGPEDQVIVSRLEDLLLWEENGGIPRQLRFDQTLGGQLTVKLVAYGYAAFTAARYPGATALIGGNAAAGNGLIAPTF